VNLIEHIKRQRDFSYKTFGPDYHSDRIINHIKKELKEIEDSPYDLEEWIDVILLALDGAWRTGAEPEVIASMLSLKQEKNENRNWPDWKTLGSDTPIEHIKDE
jgi:hypothetical protein